MFLMGFLYGQKISSLTSTTVTAPTNDYTIIARYNPITGSWCNYRVSLSNILVGCFNPYLCTDVWTNNITSCINHLTFHSNAEFDSYVRFDAVPCLNPIYRQNDTTVFGVAVVNKRGGNLLWMSLQQLLSYAGTGSEIWGLTGSNVYLNDNSGNVGIGTLTPRAELDVNGTVLSTNYIVKISKHQADSLIFIKKLRIGTTYKITGVEPTLYGGTDIFLQALSDSTFSSNGTGIFYNPRYNQRIAGFGIWSNINYFDTSSVHGIFTIGDRITANNGARGVLVGDINILAFYAVQGDWSGATSITGDALGATANISSIVMAHYNINDTVFWGGSKWKNLHGYVGATIDAGYTNQILLDTAWAMIIDANQYNTAYDEISYDYSNDHIIRRYEAKNDNEVICTFADLANFLYNPIAVFQWGNRYNEYNGTVRIIDNHVKDSYLECVNFTGSYCSNNELIETSAINSNVFLSNSYLTNNSLSGASSLAYNSLSGGSSLTYNSLSGGSYLYSNSLSGGSSLAYNSLTGASSLTTNSLSGASSLTYNSLSGASSLTNNSLSGGSYLIYNSLSGASSLTDNSLSGASSLAYNSLSDNSYSYSNSLSGGSYLHSNSLSDDSSLAYNSLSGRSSLIYNSFTGASSLTTNSLSGGSYLYSNSLSGSSSLFYNRFTGASSLINNSFTGVSRLTDNSLSHSFINNNFNGTIFSTNTNIGGIIQNNNFQYSNISSIDFIYATLLYLNTYTKQIITTSDGNVKIMTISDLGVITMRNINQ